MKKIIFSTLISIATLLVLSIITSITFSLLQYYKAIKINPYLLQVISLALFLISGMIFGLINKKQGMLGSIIFILVYVIFVLIFDVFTKSHETVNLYFLFVIGKCLAYMIGAILSVNIKRH